MSTHLFRHHFDNVLTAWQASMAPILKFLHPPTSPRSFNLPYDSSPFRPSSSFFVRLSQNQNTKIILPCALTRLFSAYLRHTNFPRDAPSAYSSLFLPSKSLVLSIRRSELVKDSRYFVHINRWEAVSGIMLMPRFGSKQLMWLVGCIS